MAERTPEEITEGIEKAREALTEGDAAAAAYLLDVPAEDVRRICSEK